MNSEIEGQSNIPEIIIQRVATVIRILTHIAIKASDRPRSPLSRISRNACAPRIKEAMPNKIPGG